MYRASARNLGHAVDEELDLEDEKRKIPCRAILAISIVQFALAPILLCYGVFLIHFVSTEEVFPFEDGLWTVIIFVSTSKVSEWATYSYCKNTNKSKTKYFRTVIIVSSVLLFSSFAVISAFRTSLAAQTILYGFSGGFLSQVILVHMKLWSVRDHNEKSMIFETLGNIFKPLCLFIFPYVLLVAVRNLGAGLTQLILASNFLYIIPACFLIRSKQQPPLQDDAEGQTIQKFPTLERLAAIEMSDLSVSNNNNHSSTELLSSSSDEEEDEYEQYFNGDGELGRDFQDVNGSPIQMYFQNAGVNIMPGIPEENETDEEREDLNEISGKRLSKISAFLQNLRENGLHRDVTLSATNLFQPGAEESSINSLEDENRSKVPAEAVVLENRKNCFNFSSDFRFALKVKQRKVRRFLVDCCCRSVRRNFCNLYVYPAILSHSLVTFLSTVFLASAPHIALQKSRETASKLDLDEGVFLLVIIGFGWMFFLAGCHVVKKLSDLKIKTIFIFGLFVQASSMFMLRRYSNDNLTVSCILFGLGHGIVGYTEAFAHERFFGKSRWLKNRAAVETSSAVIVTIFYLFIYFGNLKITVLLIHAHWLFAFNAIFWTVSFIIKEIVLQTRNYRRHARERFPDYNF